MASQSLFVILNTQASNVKEIRIRVPEAEVVVEVVVSTAPFPDVGNLEVVAAEVPVFEGKDASVEEVELEPYVDQLLFVRINGLCMNSQYSIPCSIWKTSIEGKERFHRFLWTIRAEPIKYSALSSITMVPLYRQRYFKP
jgi:hypothetical protein